MTPGAPTPTERIDELRADLFRKANPYLPLDPSLRFNVDIMPKRRPLQKKETA